MYFHASCHCNSQDLIYRQDLSTGLVDKCTPMGVGYGAKAFTVPQNIEGMYEMRGALAISHLMF